MSELSDQELLAGALDAGDYATTAAALLALPESTDMPRETIARMFKIAIDEIQASPLDIRKLETAAKAFGGVE